MSALDMTLGEFFKQVVEWEKAPASSLAPFQLSAIAMKRDGEEILSKKEDLAGGWGGVGGVGVSPVS